MKRALTPQLEHPQLPQLPLQLEQLAQEHGDMLVAGDGDLFSGYVVTYLVCLCVDLSVCDDGEWMKRRKRDGKWNLYLLYM